MSDMKWIFLIAIAVTILSTSAVRSNPAAVAIQGSNFSQILQASKSARGSGPSYHLAESTSLCCKICTQGKACGDTCISRDKICHVGQGCACDG